MASETVTAGTPPATGAACASLFMDIAGTAETLRRLFYTACEGGDDAPAILSAGACLAERMGLLAQRAAAHCGGGAGIQSEDQWLFAPVSAEALQVLSEGANHG